MSYFKLTVGGPARDLHSGVFGRTVHEPMTNLIALMSRLVDGQGKILIPGVDEMVEPPTESERYLQHVPDVIDYSLTDFSLGRSTRA